MSSRRSDRLWWAIFAFVTWNVVFDRAVAVAGSEFAREQVLRYQQGQPPRSIDDAFRPQVRAAAVTATGWAVAILGAGGLITVLGRRRTAAAS